MTKNQSKESHKGKKLAKLWQLWPKSHSKREPFRQKIIQPNFVVCLHERSNANRNSAEMKAELRQEEDEDYPVLPGIVQDIVDVLSVFRDPGSNHFLRYITAEDIATEFREGRNKHGSAKRTARGSLRRHSVASTEKKIAKNHQLANYSRR